MQNVKNQCQDQTNNKAFNNPLNSELPHKILYNINMHSLNKNIIKSQTHIFTHHMIDDPIKIPAFWFLQNSSMCLRSRPGSPNVVRLLNVKLNDDRMTG